MLLACLVASSIAAAAPDTPAVGAPAPAEASAVPLGRRARRWLAHAEAAADAGDWPTAERFAARTVAEGPHGRAQELLVLAQLDRFVEDLAQEKDRGQERVDGPDGLASLEELEQRLRTLEDVDPRSVILGVARNAIQSTRNPVMLPVAEPVCPAAAREHFHVAESAFASGRYEDAVTAYDAALEGCPENSVWWTWSGDAALRTGGPEEALKRYETALSLSPCNHSAHRFVADVGLQLEEITKESVQRSLHAAVSAVACKPDYEAGWATLDGWARGAGMQLVRGTLGELDETGLRNLLTATAMVGEGSPLDRRVAAFDRMKGTQDGLLFGMIGQIEDDQLLRAVLAWETLDRSIAPEYRAIREAELPVIVEWIARTRLRPAPEAPPAVAPPPGLVPPSG